MSMRCGAPNDVNLDYKCGGPPDFGNEATFAHVSCWHIATVQALDDRRSLSGHSGLSGAYGLASLGRE